MSNINFVALSEYGMKYLYNYFKNLGIINDNTNFFYDLKR